MDIFLFITISVVALAVLGALSMALGADSRDRIEDTHQANVMVRSL